MRFFTLAASALLALVSLVAGQAHDSPDLKIVTTFPNNPYSIVKNGQANTVVFSITNPPKDDRLLTLQSITGAFLNPKKTDGQRGRVLRNMTTTTFKSRPLRSVGGRPVQIPFDFVPEFRPQELSVEFSLLVNDEQTGKKHRIEAYRGAVQVVEPPKNWFDLQLLSVYVIAIAAIVGVVYFLYTSYVISEEKGAGPKKFEKPAVVQQSGFKDEWIPEHHLRSRKGKGKSAGALSSGDDEPSSPKRKGKGRK
ncbi:uncharacterized protein MEPE_03059 [Melanopsichium pennsylvanicum]|uniref:Translocon-associated protein subunit alpha n=2 Tax=Melanopsichium pennsylvanicum TaxID=63383 RepID=A0AAJ4XKR3_9BASI|nr:conserved hypothetical protein [Melanopsichium pennsylvanicum 4]SNX84350.1 uncharacterized protein MEPE_03059 [Melanopsichium pennsylvanicum]